jgi:hypothetical protein
MVDDVRQYDPKGQSTLTLEPGAQYVFGTLHGVCDADNAGQ